jgi:hypothetical protein
MVNTFITRRRRVVDAKTKQFKRYKPDYAGSAKDLDVQRLRKQCVEAYQILNILLQLREIARLSKSFYNLASNSCPQEFKMLRLPLNIPETLSECHHPIAKIADNHKQQIGILMDIRKRYLDGPTRFLMINGVLHECFKDKLPYPLKKSSKYSLTEDGREVIIWCTDKEKLKIMMNHRFEFPDPDKYDLSGGKRYRVRSPLVMLRKDVILPTDTIYSLGYSSHPIIKMWVGYEDSLKLYINKHIRVYNSLKTKGGERCHINIKSYNIPDKRDIIHPWWITQTKAVILSHRGSLIRKNPSHYTRKFDTPDLFIEECGYIWAGNLIEDDIVTLTNIPKKKLYAVSKKKYVEFLKRISHPPIFY